MNCIFFIEFCRKCFVSSLPSRSQFFYSIVEPLVLGSIQILFFTAYGTFLWIRSFFSMSHIPHLLHMNIKQRRDLNYISHTLWTIYRKIQTRIIWAQNYINNYIFVLHNHIIGIIILNLYKQHLIIFKYLLS